jgi:hypothetical protein
LVEIDTDNVTHEIRSPVTGVLSKVLVNDGGSVVAGPCSEPSASIEAKVFSWDAVDLVA